MASLVCCIHYPQEKELINPQVVNLFLNLQGMATDFRQPALVLCLYRSGQYIPRRTR